MVRPVGIRMLKALLARKTLKRITMSKSCRERLSGRAGEMLKESGIAIGVEAHSGRALGMGLEKITDVVEMHRDDLTYREIEESAGIPKSTAHYLVRYAARDKLKRPGGTVYFEEGK